MELQPDTIDYPLKSILSVKESVDYMFDRLMQTLPNDNAKLFFLQWVNPEYIYYFQVRDKLNQLKEQCE